MELPIFSVSVRDNFPSPIQFGSENCLDIDKFLVKNQEHTFLMQVKGDLLADENVCHNDLLVVDCSLKPRSKDLIIAVANREFILRRFVRKQNRAFLQNTRKESSPIEFKQGKDVNIWGVVTHVVHRSRSG